jgi:hypothetical protein
MFDNSLTTRTVDRDDTQARVDHYDRVGRAGCLHDAIIYDGAVTLVSCDVCLAPNKD